MGASKYGATVQHSSLSTGCVKCRLARTVHFVCKRSRRKKTTPNLLYKPHLLSWCTVLCTVGYRPFLWHQIQQLNSEQPQLAQTLLCRMCCCQPQRSGTGSLLSVRCCCRLQVTSPLNGLKQLIQSSCSHGRVALHSCIAKCHATCHGRCLPVVSRAPGKHTAFVGKSHMGRGKAAKPCATRS